MKKNGVMCMGCRRTLVLMIAMHCKRALCLTPKRIIKWRDDPEQSQMQSQMSHGTDMIQQMEIIL